MTLTTLEIKDKTFNVKFRGYSIDEVNEFLDMVIDDYEEIIRANHDKEQRIKDLEDKIAYFDNMKDSLTQSVILAQETSDKVKMSAKIEADNILNKAQNDAFSLIEEAKAKANQIIRDATDDAKRVAVETEDLKRQSRLFHQRLLSVVEGQMGLVNAPEWHDLLQPTAVYLQNSDAAFKEVVEKVLEEHVPETDDSTSIDATRQFSPEEMEELQRRVAEGNAQLKAAKQASEGTSNPTIEIISDQVDDADDTFQFNIDD
ncbi:DivIVA domain-containing protein [Streptococcus sp. CSL10205-OR2]|uniref:DivIVA domain-containing protein n=1 Tax=Streptococcus sp. CSL10205-OR2 TaxID=2980558 RepID=UPI0021D8F36F|nr:DivIVA domain-containing protein [Streptococcus sp. CSL10205-OR2]MCU9534415.1 DivIVA domain-containing protein [Streptococcus sp. CSL10205-OR2]